MDTPYLGLILYMVLIAAVAAWTWGKNQSTEDFILGGRKLGGWVIALSERTAAESSWLILGLSGALYAVGLVELWTVLGCVTGIVVYWYVVARRLRVRSEELGAITLPEYFFKIAGGWGAHTRVVSMLIITFFFSFYVAAQFLGAGKTLEQTFGIDPTWGMPVAALVVVAYTMMGGFTAVCYTDVVQAALMVFTLVVMPIIGLWFISSHGWSVWEAMQATGDTASLTGGKTGWGAAAAVIGGMSWGLGYLGQPHLVTKFMAIKSPDDVATGRRVAIVWTLLAYGGAALVGVVGITLVYHAGLGDGALAGLDASSVAVADGGDKEKILPALATFLFPAWVAGILISGAVAAMMSTADSQLLITTSTVVEDLWVKTLGRPLSSRAAVHANRAITVLVGVVAFLLAVWTVYTEHNIIYEVVSLAWAGLGSSFGPALLLSLWWRKLSGAGVLASMVTGAGTVIGWKIALMLSDLAGGIGLIEGLEGAISVRFTSFVLALAAAVVVSLVVPARTPS